MSRNVKPIIIDAGKQKRRRVKQLKAGEGPLLDEVQAAVARVYSTTDAAQGKQVIPVVIVYERRPRKDRDTKAPFRLGLFGL